MKPSKYVLLKLAQWWWLILLWALFIALFVWQVAYVPLGWSLVLGLSAYVSAVLGFWLRTKRLRLDHKQYIYRFTADALESRDESGNSGRFVWKPFHGVRVVNEFVVMTFGQPRHSVIMPTGAVTPEELALLRTFMSTLKS